MVRTNKLHRFVRLVFSVYSSRLCVILSSFNGLFSKSYKGTWSWMVRLFGDQHVDDLCRALFVDARTHCPAPDHIHHLLGARELSSMDGFPSRAHYLTCRFHGLSPTQGQSRRDSQCGGFGLYRGGCHLPVFFSRSPTIGRLRSLPCLHSTRIRQFS